MSEDRERRTRITVRFGSTHGVRARISAKQSKRRKSAQEGVPRGYRRREEEMKERGGNCMVATSAEAEDKEACSQQKKRKLGRVRLGYAVRDREAEGAGKTCGQITNERSPVGQLQGKGRRAPGKSVEKKKLL